MRGEPRGNLHGMLHVMLIFIAMQSDMVFSVPAGILITTIVTPILSAVAALFWLLNNEKNKRIEDRDKIIESQNARISGLEATVGQYRDSIIPAIQAGQRATVELADLYARRLSRGDQG